MAIQNIWKTLPKHHPVELDAMQIMPTRYAPTIRNPNNVYSQISPIEKSISTVVRSFKSECTKQIRYANDNQYLQIWQRNFYDHIIRNEKELHKIRRYIQNNPIKWELDHDNPSNWK